MRSCSIRSSIALNASVTSATSLTAPSSWIRRPGSCGSILRISAARRCSGSKARRTSHTLTPSSTIVPSASTTISVACGRALTVTGDKASTRAAAMIAPALIETTRPNKDTGKG